VLLIIRIKLGHMKTIGIRFRQGGKIYDFNPGTNEVGLGDVVVVETEEGIEKGEVAYIDKEITGFAAKEIKPILRKAGKKDLEVLEKWEGKKQGVMEDCQKIIKKHKLSMKLVDAEMAVGGDKLTFFFTAPARIDFRELVRDLMGHFSAKIRLQQIGPRDAARLQNGVGMCGQGFCCSNFLNNLEGVTLEAARAQELENVGSAKITGSCGRLMCCLVYEEKMYQEMAKSLPAKGATVRQGGKKGVVVGRNILKETYNIKLEDGTVVKNETGKKEKIES